jgi:hypothetical protein
MARKISKFAIIGVLGVISSKLRLPKKKVVVDMRKLTCGELNILGFQGFAAIWLSGFYNANTIKDYCKNNTRATVVSVAERALGITMPK